jgi:DNA-directed RNA polymerase I, II, and III subunit RPABC2
MSESDEDSVASIEDAEMESLAGEDTTNKDDVINDDDEDDEDDEDDDDEDEDQDFEKKAQEINKLKDFESQSKKELLLGSDSNFKFDMEDMGDDANDITNEDEDEDDDELPMDKIDFDIKEDYLVNYHPEKLHHNYDEVYNVSKITRNKNNEIIDDFHKTLPVLTKYEYSKILGYRASQLNSGSKPFIDLEDNIIDSFVIAKMELNQKKLPFIIRRPLPNGSSEYWKIQDLEIL